MAVPVVLTTGARPVTAVESNGVPITPVTANGEPVTLVDSGGEPVTLLNADGTLWSAETDLQRILALSPSLLIWPANGAGWQGTSGGTLSATGQPVGLLPDLAALEGKTQAEWLASAPELVTNGGFDANVTGWAEALGSGAAIAWDAGRIRLTANASSGARAYQVITTVSGRLYRLQITATAGTAANSGYRITTDATGGPTGQIAAETGIAGDWAREVLFVATSTSTTIAVLTADTVPGGDTCFFDNISIRELPGNHLRAGPWASPSDAARGTFQNDAINLDGVNDYYSLLNAISITTDMTVVRAFKRASAGINSMGLGGGTDPYHAGLWFTGTNSTFVQLGNTQSSGYSVSTATGPFVDTAARNASDEYIRRNGTQIGTRIAPTLIGTLSALGRWSSTGYNNGEISFLAVFPTELTGANLALVEQIAASTNGSVLA